MDYDLLEGRLDSTAKTRAVCCDYAHLYRYFVCEGSQAYVYLKSQMDIRAIEEHQERKARRREARDGGRHWKRKRTWRNVESGEAPAAVLSSMMMNYFDRDYQD